MCHESCPQITKQSRDELTLLFKSAVPTGMKYHEELFRKSGVTRRDGRAREEVPMTFLGVLGASVSISLSQPLRALLISDCIYFVSWVNQKYLLPRIIMLRV